MRDAKKINCEARNGSVYLFLLSFALAANNQNLFGSLKAKRVPFALFLWSSVISKAKEDLKYSELYLSVLKLLQPQLTHLRVKLNVTQPVVLHHQYCSFYKFRQELFTILCSTSGPVLSTLCFFHHSCKLR